MSRDATTWSAEEAGETLDPSSDAHGRVQPAVLTGTKLVGRYEVGPVIGRGGTGQVHRAHDHITGDTVAIKFISMISPTSLRMLRRELTALRLFDLPGVVRLRDDGEDGGQAFIVMDLLAGGRFDDLAARGGWETWEHEACAMLEALARVHFAGVLHRDLKPGNILLDAAGRPVITDFGLAQGAAVERVRGAFAEGTPRYMAPEQRRGEPCDERTDLFAVGVMFDEMLAGSRVPPRVRQVVDAMLAPDPADRPRSVPDVLDALGAGTVTLLGSVAGLPEVAGETELRALFDEPELTFLHVAEDAASVLMARTGGRRDAVGAELERWVRAGRGQWVADRFRMDRPAVEALMWEEDPELRALVSRSRDTSAPELAQWVVGRARELHLRGRSARAAGLLQASLLALDDEPAARAALEQLVCVALALGQADLLRSTAYLAQRAGAPDLVRLLQGWELAMRGEFGRAIERLSAPVADRETELARLGALVIAYRYGDPVALSALLEDVLPFVQGDRLAEGRWRIWRGNAAYARGDYAAAVRENERAARLLAEAPSWRLAALTNGGAAALEVPDLARAARLAREARDLARGLRHAVAEGRAAWLDRTASFRRSVPLSWSRERVEAAAQVSASLAAQTALTEAAIALAAGDGASAAELGRLSAFTYGANNPSLRALGLALAGVRPDGDAALEPALRLQAEAMLAPSASPPAAADLEAWFAAWPLSDPDQRLDFFTLNECRARLGAPPIVRSRSRRPPRRRRSPSRTR